MLDAPTYVGRPPVARLEVTDQNGRRMVPIEKDRLAVGRRAENDLCLAGTDVSRDHAEIVLQAPGCYLIRDRNSRYGTFVNDEQVTEQQLRHRDIIRFGRGGGASAVFLIEEATSEQTSTSVVTGLRQVSALLDGLRALGSGRVLDEVLALVIDSAIDLSGAERGFVMLANPDGSLQFMLARSRNRKTLPGTTFETSRKIPEEVFESGKSRIVADLLDGDVAGLHQGTIAIGIRHVLCVPLRLVPYGGGAVDAPREVRKVGVLYMDGREKGDLLSPTTVEAIETLATEASVAIEHARLYREAIEKAQMDREMRIAGEIQRMLVPARQKTTANLDIAGTTIPCRAIGGDFFDLYEVPGDGTGFAVADISGKGVPAALLAAALQGAFAAHATTCATPADAISVGNAVLYGRFEGKFATMFYGVMGRDGSLAYCNAGHNPPLLIRTSGEIEKLDKGGCVLGLFAGISYEEGHMKMSPGDTLLVFSDGLCEANDAAGNEFGDELIERLAVETRTLQPAAMLQRYLEEVAKFVGGAPARDDLTILVVRCK